MRVMLDIFRIALICGRRQLEMRTAPNSQIFDLLGVVFVRLNEAIN
jgi:hypothetical protein